jgi:putative oxidoreductase
MATGLLLIRVGFGVLLAGHGAQKLFGWFGGYGLRGTGQFLEQLGFRPGRVQAAVAGSAELLGGLFLAAGFLTPGAAAAIVAVMLVAAVSVHLKSGFFAQDGGYEYTLVLGGAALALGFTGPGSLSLDAALGLTLSGVAWGLFAGVGGVVAGALPLLARRPTPQPVRRAA